MTDLITPREIEATQVYKRSAQFQKNILVKRSNRSLLEEALIYYKAHGVIPQKVGAKNIELLTEIIEKNGLS